MELRTVTDQLGRTVSVCHSPQRIVSTVPSQTELLHHLGLDQRVVGITRFCVHPESWYRSKPRIGGTKKLDIERIAALEPDLILANREENERHDIEQLAQHFPVWVSDVHDLASAMSMIGSVADLTGTDAGKLLERIREGFRAIVPLEPASRALYLIWKDPYMAAGKGTFIDDMLQRCGLTNVLSQFRYPTVSEQEMIELEPDVILLSSEPYPFREHHAEELRKRFPNATVRCVDGEMFSWYGSRMKTAPLYFSHLIGSIRK